MPFDAIRLSTSPITLERRVPVCVFFNVCVCVCVCVCVGHEYVHVCMETHAKSTALRESCRPYIHHYSTAQPISTPRAILLVGVSDGHLETPVGSRWRRGMQTVDGKLAITNTNPNQSHRWCENVCVCDPHPQITRGRVL